MGSAANNPSVTGGRARSDAFYGGTPPQIPAPVHVPPPIPTPVTHVVYSPFSATEAQRGDGSTARLLGTSWENRQKFTVIRHGQSAKPLAGLHPATVLYIVCHCSAGSSVVSDNNGNSLDAAQLAARLASDDLSKDHQTMKLWACSGGKDDPTFGESFGKRLKMALTGYQNLSLWAYTSTLWSLDALPDEELAKNPVPRYDPPMNDPNKQPDRLHKLATVLDFDSANFQSEAANVPPGTKLKTKWVTTDPSGNPLGKDAAGNPIMREKTVGVAPAKARRILIT